MALLLPAFPLHVHGTFSFCTLHMCPLPCLTLPSPLFNRPPPCPWGSINIISSSEAADMNHRVTVNNSSSVPVPYLGIHTAWSLQSRLGAMYEILQCVCVYVCVLLIAWLYTFAAKKPWSLPRTLSLHHVPFSLCRILLRLLVFMYLSAFMSSRCL